MPLEELTPQRLREALLPMDAALRRYPAIRLDARAAQAVRTGQAVEGPPLEGTSLARAYGPDGTFLAVLEYRPDRGVWHPRKVFGEPQGRRG